MIIECACKKYKFAVKAEEIGINGRVVQCGVCDQKWFQEPASTEEFKLLKENLVKEKENIETKAENKKNLKDKDKKNYIPIKYKDKSDTSYFKILIIIFFINCCISTIKYKINNFYRYALMFIKEVFTINFCTIIIIKIFF